MKFLCSLAIGLMMVASAEPESKRAAPSPRPNDQLMLAEQFLRWYFPQLVGRYADIVFTAEIRLFDFPPPSEARGGGISFSVEDWCDVPPNPQRGSFGPRSFPCSQGDKKYKPPLKGTIVFARVNGRLAITSLLLNGTLLNNNTSEDPTPHCSGPQPARPEEILPLLQLPRLEAVMGGTLKVSGIEQDPNDWEVVVRMESPRRRYQVWLDECGVIYRFEPL